MQNKYIVGIFFFVTLIIPVFSAHASIVCVGGICSDPYNGLLNQSNQLQQQSQSMESQQAQSNQSTINRMKSQYGLAAYSSCTSNMLNVDTANPYTLATWLSYDEPCMASNKAKQAQQIQCSAGYVLVNGSCESGNQGCVNKWGANTIWTGSGCDCASGYKWGGSGNNQCVATTPTCTTNSTYNGSQCICNAGYSSLSGVCISNQAALSALHPTTSTVPAKISSPHSSGLSTAQISSIISLIQAFGADASVIASVQVALGQ